MTLVDTLGHLLSAADPKTEGGYSLVTAERLAEVIRAAPAAARAVRDALDPDGLRAALRGVMTLNHGPALPTGTARMVECLCAVHEDARRLLEGTPDAD